MPVGGTERGATVPEGVIAGHTGARRHTPLVAAAVAVTYAVATVALHLRSTFLAVSSPLGGNGYPSDWDQYREVAGAPLSSSDFWAGAKSMGYPLLIKVFGESTALHWATIALSIVAWLALAGATAALFRSRAIALLGAVLLLAVSLSERVQVWNDLTGSEALSTSLFVLAFAAVLVLVNPRLGSRRGVRVAAMAVAAVVVAWWVWTRDSNAYVLLLVTLVAGVWAVWRRRRGAALFAVAALVLAVPVLWSSASGERWVYPYYNIVLNRVLPDEDLAARWRDAGMPDPPALLRREGQIAATDSGAIFTDPRLASFRRWVDEHGTTTYLATLLTKPSLSVGGPTSDFRQLFTAPVEVYGHLGGTSYEGSPLDPGFNSLFVPDLGVFLLWLAAVVGATAWLLARPVGSVGRAAVGVVLAVFLLGFAHAWIVWVGDAHNIPRHAITASLQVRTSGWILLLLALDAFIGRPQPDDSSPTPATQLASTMPRT
jgi:hypothetical protein